MFCSGHLLMETGIRTQNVANKLCKHGTDLLTYFLSGRVALNHVIVM